MILNTQRNVNGLRFAFVGGMASRCRSCYDEQALCGQQKANLSFSAQAMASFQPLGSKPMSVGFNFEVEYYSFNVAVEKGFSSVSGESATNCRTLLSDLAEARGREREKMDSLTE